MLEMPSNIFPFIHQFSEKCTVLCILQAYLVQFFFYLTRTCALPPSCSCHCVYSSRCDLPGGNPLLAAPPRGTPPAGFGAPSFAHPGEPSLTVYSGPMHGANGRRSESAVPLASLHCVDPMVAMVVLETVHLPANMGAMRQECASISRMEMKGRFPRCLPPLSAWWFCGHDPVLPVCHASDLCPGRQPLSCFSPSYTDRLLSSSALGLVFLH